jgi:hypothetical protein
MSCAEGERRNAKAVEPVFGRAFLLNDGGLRVYAGIPTAFDA